LIESALSKSSFAFFFGEKESIISASLLFFCSFSSVIAGIGDCSSAAISLHII